MRFFNSSADNTVMRKSVFVSIVVVFAFFSAFLFAQSKPLYVLPKYTPSPSTSTDSQQFIAGSDKGLFRIIKNKTLEPLWTEGKVKQILRVPFSSEKDNTNFSWYILTNKGILYTSDLEHFELRNTGLPFLTVKKYDGKSPTLESQVDLLKDIAVDPIDPLTLVTATRDNVYLSTDGGQNWRNMGSVSTSTTGIKAVAVAHIPNVDFKADPAVSSAKNRADELEKSDIVLFLAHSYYGFAYRYATGSKWIEAQGGLFSLPSYSYPDELSDIITVADTKDDGSYSVRIFSSQTFVPKIYEFNWKLKKSVAIYEGKEPADTIDSLNYVNGNFVYMKPGTLAFYDAEAKGEGLLPPDYALWRSALSIVPGEVSSVFIPQSRSGFSSAICLSELWLFNPEKVVTEYVEPAMDKKCIYVPEWKAYTVSGMQKYKKIITDNKLNGLVIDMKDDYGLLRYNSKEPSILKKAKISSYAIDVEQFVAEFKKDDIYLIARIPVFKDKQLANYDQKQYAIWDKALNKPWIGTKGADANGVMQYYDENWVDPYSEEVWEYNIAIAKELIARGFDEVQYDYIRFPTDGLNIGRMQFRWQNPGMDKTSALISFLSYARENIKAPLGIDIYGANGWFRTGSRTGQDVELLSEYVDIICPMFYPSHFGNGDMNYAPYTERPYRIYFYGTYRNSVIGRNNIIVRPWVQAFYMPVKYDRDYYDKNYVRREVFGVRDSVGHGYMYWNQSGRYEDLSPDPADAEYPWTASEASPKFRKPALSTGADIEPFTPVIEEIIEEEKAASVSLLDSVLEQIDVDEDNSSIDNDISQVSELEKQEIVKANTSPSDMLLQVQSRWQNIGNK